jgi:hypothetical protein
MELAASLVIGGLITIAVALAVEWVKRPRLAVEIARPASDARWEILHIKVINKPVAGWAGRFVLRNDAPGCRVRATFRRRNVTGPSTPLFGIDGRWSATPQPLSVIAGTQGREAIFDVNKLPQSERFDLPPDSAGEAVAIAIKLTGDRDAYAFSNSSYIAGDFRHEPFKLGVGQFEVEVTASVGAVPPTTRTFVLTCDSTGFTLTE